MSPRYALSLLFQAPAGSAVHAAIHGSEARSWSVDTYMLAAVVDLLAGANYQRAGGKGRKPRPVQRPGSGKAKQKRVVRVADIRRAQRLRESAQEE